MSGAALLVLAALAAPAQVVSGTAMDTDERWPLAGAALLLVDSTGAVADSTRAGEHGEFRLGAPGPGRYFIHVHMDGWAGVPSDGFDVAAARDRTFDVRVPLIGAPALAHMRSVLDDEALQRPLEELCGEPLRPWEAGLLLGVIRDRATRQPIPGARVQAIDPDGAVVRSTVSNARGNYVLCNLAAGGSITIHAEADDGRRGRTDPEIKPGMTAWYDIFLRRP